VALIEMQIPLDRDTRFRSDKRGKH
jgi:hypothetical protein